MLALTFSKQTGALEMFELDRLMARKAGLSENISDVELLDG